MQLRWPDLASGRADHAAGDAVEIAGWMATAGRASHFLLSPEPSCCGGCLPSDPLFAVEVFANAPIVPQPQALRLTGTWLVGGDDASGWRYQLHDARALAPPGWRAIGRRGVLANLTKRSTPPARPSPPPPRWTSTATPARSPASNG